MKVNTVFKNVVFLDSSGVSKWFACQSCINMYELRPDTGLKNQCSW